jgi:acyl transferase domain-containing protein
VELVPVSADIDLQTSEPHVFVWSAGDSDGIARLFSAYRSHFRAVADSEDYVRALASTLFRKRTLLSWRAFATASSVKELMEKMDRPLSSIQSNPDRKLAFVFTGQGANWLGMGKELWAYPVFRECVEQAKLYLERLQDSTNLDTISPKPSDVCLALLSGNSTESVDINAPQYSQPACTILQVALVDLLHSFGVKPAMVVGHSSGEIAAAYATGVMSRESAWRLAYYRGIFSSTLYHPEKPSGSMLAVAVSHDSALMYVDHVLKERGSGALHVACINSPNNVTFSGDPHCIQSLKKLLDEEGIFNRKLPVPVAYHSPQMRKIAAEYENYIGLLEPQRQAFRTSPMISTVTGHVVSADTLLSPSYWVHNLVSPVKFADALKRCCAVPPTRVAKKIDLSHRNFINATGLIEIGPHSTLKAPIRETLVSIGCDEAVSYTAALVRNRCGKRSLMEAMGMLHCRGYSVDIFCLNSSGDKGYPEPPVLPSLPEYPFNHTNTYWSESRISRNIRFRKHGMNEFLGSPVSDWNPLEPRWRWFLTSSPTASCAWVGDHKVISL